MDKVSLMWDRLIAMKYLNSNVSLVSPVTPNSNQSKL